MTKSFLSVLLIFAFSSILYADVSIKSESLQEKTINKQTTWAKATKVIPGTKVRYINTISNNGNEIAQNLVITNSIPKHMLYVDGSAKCTGVCSTTYSLDGKLFDVPAKLFVTENGKKRAAKAAEYKAIRWIVQTLGAKQSSSVQFDAILE
jgi:uncharacterized repeat protein (TIGR01451 family)